MSQVFNILLATALILAASMLLGNLFLRAVHADLRRSEAKFLAFVIGSALLTSVIFALAYFGLARRSVFFGVCAALIAVCVWRGGQHFPQDDFAPLPKRWGFTFLTIYAVFGLLYLETALLPEASVDGSTHYLSRAVLYAREFGFAAGVPAPDGIEPLFLFAFAIGRQSAAAMTELLFLLALPLGMLAYARRIDRARAGVVGALLFFLCPIAGLTGTIAASDAAVACAAFAFFYALNFKLRAPAGLLFGWLSWILTPWLLREFDKPILHLNAWYPRLPLDLTVLGERVDGLLGPVFLLAPMALLSLRHPAGRRLMLATLIFAAPCLGAMETRALIAALPFLSLALALVLTEWQLAAPAVLAAHVIFSWPGVVALYADDETWLPKIPEWRAALRVEPEDKYLMRALPGYYTGRVLETLVPEGQRVLALSPFQQVYHTRQIVDGQQSDLGRRAREIIWAAYVPDRLPVQRYEFRLPEQALRGVTLIPEDFARQARWGVNEIHFLRAGVEIARSPEWKITASPNPDVAGAVLDGNPTTRWSSGRTFADQMRIEITFSAEQTLDQIVVETAADQGRSMQLTLDPTHVIRSLRAADQPLPESIRMAAIAGVKQTGLRWMLANLKDPVAMDLLNRADEWGLEIRGVIEGYAIFYLK
ncbi:MAG: discoidin domain-containing protein [Acidobacteriota bacterium]